MESIVRRSPDGRSSELVVVFARASEVLEEVVLDLLWGGWEEDLRRLVFRMAGALRQAARDAGWWDRESVLRAVESLLALSFSEILPVRSAAGVKLLELLALLKNAPASRSA
jgi:hypothetical protein